MEPPVLKKRLIGVITVRDGWAVQSIGYRRWLPLGRPECLAENLDRWGADEIVVSCIDRHGAGPDLDLLRRLGAAGLATPLTYGGGIASAAQAAAVVAAGADRVVLDALLWRDTAEVQRVSELLGAQAVIAALPLSLQAGALHWLDHVQRRSQPLPAALRGLVASSVVAELLVIDWRHEGHPGGFDPQLLDALTGAGLAGKPVIAFGGISEPAQAAALLQRPQVVAVAVGNFLSYREHAIQALRTAVADENLRPAAFAGTGLV